MPPFGPTSRKKLIRVLRSAGFDGPYAGGKHAFMLKEDRTLTLPNPHRGDIGSELPAPTFITVSRSTRISPHPLVNHPPRTTRRATMDIQRAELEKTRVLNGADVFAIMRRVLLRENKIDSEKEHFWITGLDGDCRILFIDLVLGGVTSATVKPMENNSHYRKSGGQVRI
uniref:HicA toxin of toxin-antitoxin n=1 Tax=Candidatus Kentrum sp. LPFa TaxID=2126335 RepID=A0A450XC94_9GAMM|nr:MAG: hypothetical protein BECKLPF1236A_GA0070988_100387 [Candidatus Kentron sp. LPFa]VFK26894.1 MAG: hypothetical protein BECKLPF1236C_GA0070990_100406 [Candidatus Kentron sp. LPFa]